MLQQERQVSSGIAANQSSFMSNLPEVSGVTIAVVASGCAILIVCLLMVLVFFCCRNRSTKSSSESSDRDASSVDRKVSSYMQYGHDCGQRQQQQQQQHAIMVSPHPSLTSTDETSVDQGSSKVFATLVSANNPLTSGAHNEGSSESEHSATLLQPSRQTQQRRIIYEVVV